MDVTSLVFAESFFAATVQSSDSSAHQALRVPSPAITQLPYGRRWRRCSYSRLRLSQQNTAEVLTIFAWSTTYHELFYGDEPPQCNHLRVSFGPCRPFPDDDESTIGRVTTTKTERIILLLTTTVSKHRRQTIRYCMKKSPVHNRHNYKLFYFKSHSE